MLKPALDMNYLHMEATTIDFSSIRLNSADWKYHNEGE
jgi:hypothetical protein